MDERIAKLRTSRDAEVLARNAERLGHLDIAEHAKLRALELKTAEKSLRRKILQEGRSAERPKLVPVKLRADAEALFLNGVFEKLLIDILDAQAANAELICYLQPYKPKVIKRLQQDPPTLDRPWKLFLSLTHSLGLVSFEADVVEWRDKAAIGGEEVEGLNEHIATYQPRERGLHFEGEAGEYGRNLLGVVRLRRVEPALAVSGFIKTSDGLPLRERTRAGSWSYVTPPELRQPFEVVSEESVRAAEANGLQRALGRSAKERSDRLEAANPVPQQIFVMTKAFRRNQDVVAEVLSRAGGHCEDCRQPAPFFRAKDGTPFLEVHHVVTLAQGGMDTVENAKALCPNCHRKRHFGQADSHLVDVPY